jgi:hypothetical protein
MLVLWDKPTCAAHGSRHVKMDQGVNILHKKIMFMKVEGKTLQNHKFYPTCFIDCIYYSHVCLQEIFQAFMTHIFLLFLLTLQ